MLRLGQMLVRIGTAAAGLLLVAACSPSASAPYLASPNTHVEHFQSDRMEQAEKRSYHDQDRVGPAGASPASMSP